MANRLKDAVSPYLRSHADNPVDWYPWSDAAFAEAKSRGVPVLVSIGYSTCHWCHVMARESFSDPDIATFLADNFVSIKVDREEHPDVDASYLAAAGAFTANLGWPLNVFVTPDGKPFYAGTYWPPTPVGEHPSFRQVLDAVLDAWSNRREQVDETAAAIAAALIAPATAGGGMLPSADGFASAVRQLGEYEDTEFGGFGGAPKFPSAPVIDFLLERAAAGDADAAALAERTLAAIRGASSDKAPDGTSAPFTALRDRVDGGFFRYATRRDWTEPHYERMLYDNAQLLRAYARLSQLQGGAGSENAAGSGAAAGSGDAEASIDAATGIADFLIGTMERPSGGFASAQDSESTVDGERVEGGYFALDASARRRQHPPALDGKVLTGWNGLAIGALADAGFILDREPWIAAARRAADYVLERHFLADGTVLRASIDGRSSEARATLEDFGMFAGGLLSLASATGEVRYALAARDLVDRAIAAGSAGPFGVPGGADPLLASHGLVLDIDPSEGAYPSGLSAMAGACYRLYLLTGYSRHREATARTIELLAPLGIPRPIAFGAALAVASELTEPIGQLVVVSDARSSALVDVARGLFRGGMSVTVLSARQAADFAAAGFELFTGRQREAAYLCHNFVCRLPVTAADELRALLEVSPG